MQVAKATVSVRRMSCLFSLLRYIVASLLGPGWSSASLIRTCSIGSSSVSIGL